MLTLSTCPFSISEKIGMKPSFSYIYAADKQHYLFSDPKIEELSHIPPILIKDKVIIFTLRLKWAILYENEIVESFESFLKKIKLPDQLDQNLLEKIAIVANYFAEGDKYKYISGTAKENNSTLTFQVKEETNLLDVDLSLKEYETISYRRKSLGSQDKV